MKKLLVVLAAILTTVGIANASNTLYEYYAARGQNLPSVEERAVLAGNIGILDYKGTETQNIALLGYLQGNEMLGADLPQQYALFDDYLASGITKTATSLTLTNGTTRDGVTLSGRICFTIDINTPTAEYVCGTAAGTAISSLERGVLPSDPTATSSTYAFPHRRFATISITDFPFNALVRRLLQGTDDLPATLSYASSTSLGVMDKATLATLTYVDDVGAGGFTAANIASGYGLMALGTAPETVGIATSTVYNYGTQAFDAVQSSYSQGTKLVFLPSPNNNLRLDVVGVPVFRADYNVLVVNPSYDTAEDVDFAVYGTSNSDPILFIDSGLNKIGIATSTFNTYSSDFVINKSTTINGHSTTTGSFTVGGTLATGDDGFISTVSASNESVIAIPSGARRAVVYVESNNCNADCGMELNLSKNKLTATAKCGYYQVSESVTVLTATSTNWTTIGYSASGGSNCDDGTDAQAWFYRY